MKAVFVIELVPVTLVTCKVTLYIPKVLYVTVGCSNILDAGVPPGNVHNQEVGEFVLISVKVTVPPAQT